MNSIYDLLAKHLAEPRAMFLNYGLVDPGLPAESIPEEDEPYRRHFDLVRRALGPTRADGARIVEVGCGRGGNCYYLARYRAPARIVGIDPAGASLRLARSARDRGAVLMAARAERLPFSDASFDVVLSLEASHCYDDLGMFISEAHRVLRPGGTLCLTDIWDLEILRLDWTSRQRALDDAPLRLEADDDITEEVFLALAGPGGLLSWLPRMVDDSNRHVVERLERDTEAVRAHLAAGACRYRSLRLARP